MGKGKLTTIMHDRRGKIGWEAIITIAVVLLCWAANAGMMYQHITDVDRRVERLEQKFDNLAAVIAKGSK